MLFFVCVDVLMFNTAHELENNLNLVSRVLDARKILFENMTIVLFT